MAATGPYAEDLELARMCADGDEAAWDRFIREYRPILYRAADSLDATGGARDLADSLYADLYGLADSQSERKSLFRYFHGRSSLATWLRAVLAQRFVDRLRSGRRFEPLQEDGESHTSIAERPRSNAERRAPNAASLFRTAFERAVAQLPVRDRLRLGCYYVQALTLAETGRLLREHEATTSRQLARTRQALRRNIEAQLKDAGVAGAEIGDFVKTFTEDSGELDLSEMLRAAGERKNVAADRSKERALGPRA
jgi:RNA polymerase sigma factor (sigma-70 family)